MCHFWSFKVKEEKADFSSRKVFSGTTWHCRSPRNPTSGLKVSLVPVQGRLGGQQVRTPPCVTQTPGTATGKVGSPLRRLLGYHNHHGEARERQRGIAAAWAPPLGGCPGTAAPAAQDSLRNAFSDSRTPSRVAGRVCSLRRTAPNFTRALPRCRSRQVVHNAPQTRNSGRRNHKGGSLPSSSRQNLGQGTKPRHLGPTRRLPLY